MMLHDDPDVVKRFIKYVKIYTTSEEGMKEIPSTKRQFDLAEVLKDELVEIGVQEVRVDEHCYVYGTIPSNSPLEKKVPVICLCAHMDTSPDEPGDKVKPQIVRNYDGKNIVLPGNPSVIISPDETPELLKFVGEDLITSDGTTLLGADDKAGVAEIMTVAAILMRSTDIPHGEIKILFTPDEEVGRGIDALDVEKLGADYGYTLDGDEMGVLETETFNASSGIIKIGGYNIHPGYAKDKMVNAVRILGHIIAKFPVDQAPETTEEDQGYIHPYISKSTVNEASLKFILRDFDYDELKKKERLIQEIVNEISKEFPKAKIEMELKDQYKNMGEKLREVPRVIDYALEAIKRSDIEPIVKKIRGGTDGARMCFMGLPTPNIFTGGINFHSKKEFVPIIAMEKAVETVINLLQIYVEKN